MLSRTKGFFCHASLLPSNVHAVIPGWDILPSEYFLDALINKAMLEQSVMKKKDQ